MEIRAYNELYLENAMTAMATMLDYAVNYRNWKIDDFFQAFLDSRVFPHRFETGHPDTVAGKTGVELYYCITGEKTNKASEYIEFDRSAEYWVGWSLAYCQWYMNRTFQSVVSVVKPSELLHMYPVYHEMDLLQLVDAIEERIKATPTKLELLRRKLGYSQRQLADLSTVSLRSIQMYEQRNNDISKAQFNILNALARVLKCSVYDLVDGVEAPS